jgi:hypothetical protein
MLKSDQGRDHSRRSSPGVERPIPLRDALEKSPPVGPWLNMPTGAVLPPLPLTGSHYTAITLRAFWPPIRRESGPCFAAINILIGHSLCKVIYFEVLQAI